MKYPVINLGQTSNNIADLVRQYSAQQQFYQKLAVTKPEYQPTVEYYMRLLMQAQRDLARSEKSKTI
jgi:hypothetical protein